MSFPKTLSIFLSILIIGLLANSYFFDPSFNTAVVADNIPSSPVSVREDLYNGAIIAQNDNEVIDCKNKNLRGDNNTGIGILVRDKKNVTVQNCVVTDFYFGLFADNADGLKIVNSSFYNNNKLSLFDIHLYYYG